VRSIYAGAAGVREPSPLPGAGRCGFDDVVKLTFFVLDVADLPAVRAAREAVIDTASPPTSTTVRSDVGQPGPDTSVS